MGVFQKLSAIQINLKAPKGQFNSFGRYKYRSCEDILEAVKPHLASTRTALKISDELVNIGDRYYVKATALLIDTESGETTESTAYAREEESKKGMDGSQVTGAASSYARKYALNGLLAIDDVEDSDSTNTYEKTEKEASGETERTTRQPRAKRETAEEPVSNDTAESEEAITEAPKAPEKAAEAPRRRTRKTREPEDLLEGEYPDGDLPY